MSYPSFIKENYGTRRDKVVESFPLELYSGTVVSWVFDRKAMVQHDQDRDAMVEKNIPGEVREAYQERVTHRVREELVEATDIGFFLFAFGGAMNAQVDAQEARRNVNGYGKRDDVFDKMIEISGNLAVKKLGKELTFLTQVWLAYLAGIPGEMNAKQQIATVMKKNDLNYPREYLSGFHPVTKQKLNPDQLDQQFTHSRKSLKEIRNTLRDVLLLKDRDYGLKPSDHQPYAQYILDFENPNSFALMKNKLYKDLGLAPLLKQ